MVKNIESQLTAVADANPTMGGLSARAVMAFTLDFSPGLRDRLLVSAMACRKKAALKRGKALLCHGMYNRIRAPRHFRTFASDDPTMRFPRYPSPLRRQAFSLVEVTLALGIMGFALVGLIGLLPVGLATFHSATVNSTGTQIAQRLLNEAAETDFDQLVATPQTSRYFDEQGDELLAANKARAIYNTNLVVVPGTTLPGEAVNPNLATVFVQIADNPGERPMALGTDNHWIAPTGMTITSYAANVSRSK